MICAQEVAQDEMYHDKCLETLFDSKKAPILEASLNELNELAKKSVTNRVTVPGVQSKLSLEINHKTKEADKLTIVGLWGRYILKPPSSTWDELPENEHCTMLMAQAAGIETVPFGLIHLSSGEKAYITKRIDRDAKGNKFAMEDMCQLTLRLTEDKYKGSHEQIAKVIKKHSSNPLFDITRFYELVLFCFLCGNGDMHLKNFSLFKDPKLSWKLAPAYDLLSTRLVIPESKDPEELSLTIAGKKSNFNLPTFIKFGESIGLNSKQIENIIGKQLEQKELYDQIIDHSFLSQDMKDEYHQIVSQRMNVIASSD
jgi:serine/threonine-protein kinase HipA|tara:strand:- start:301 stop:1239 length:939 start_codon:yes stop_codon:yes gene_type:complete